MSAQIVWSPSAFRELERLPESIAFEIIARVDVLSAFPESGPRLQSAHPALASCRQIVVRRRYRVVYELDDKHDRVAIVAVQRCRQRLPSTRDLRRRGIVEDEP